MSNQQVDLSNAKRFIFELSFDAEDMAERRRKKIEARERAAAQAAEADAVEAEPTFSEADLEAAKAQAYDDGRAAGLAEATSQREAGLAAILETIGAQIAGLHVHQDVANEKLAADLAELGRIVMSKLLPHYIEKNGCDEVIAILNDGFARLVHEDRISITVGPDTHDLLEPRIEALAAKSGYDGRLKLVADPDMGAADIVVNWGDGRLERSADDIWREIDASLERAIGGMRDYADKLEETAPFPNKTAKPAGASGGSAESETAAPGPEPQEQPAETAVAAEAGTAVEDPIETETGDEIDTTNAADTVESEENTDATAQETPAPVDPTETIEQG